MNALDEIENLPKDALIDIIKMLGKNWLTVDGLWFQIVEKNFGLETATRFDELVWGKQSLAEARRIKKTLNITEKGPLAVARANLFLTAYFNPAFEFKIEEISPGKVIQTCIHCPNQEVRLKHGQQIFPCKKVGLTERNNFAEAIDPDVKIKCLVCPPDPRADDFWCRWEFV
ncbi:MAG: DUF6125 family protein [Pseudomonadota bacterium]